MDGATPQYGAVLKEQFFLDEGIHYLNHGAYGALSRRIMDATQAIRLEIERQPSAFLKDTLTPKIRENANALGNYLGADGANIVFTHNASASANAVLRSLVFLPGDEIVTTTHVYGSVQRTLEFAAERAGARVVHAEIPLPVIDPGDIVENILNAITARTTLVVLDEITSPIGMIMPLAPIIEECSIRGIPVLIDGAHGPGMLNQPIEEMGATWYLGNAHKWLGTSRGTGFLWTKPERQALVRPTTISMTMGQGYISAFDWPGTLDFAPWLTIQDVLAWRADLGEPHMKAYCNSMAIQAADFLKEAWGTQKAYPKTMTGFMCSVKLPIDAPKKPEDVNAIRRRLRENFKVEIDIKNINKTLWARISCAPYNEFSDIEALAEAVKHL